MEILHLIVLILHVMVAGLLLGMVVYGLLAIARTPVSEHELVMFKRIKQFGGPLAGSQLILGIALIAMEPDKFLRNPLIWAKVILFVLAGLVSTHVIDKKVKVLAGAPGDRAREQALRQAGWLLLALIVALIVLGVTAAELA